MCHGGFAAVFFTSYSEVAVVGKTYHGHHVFRVGHGHFQNGAGVHLRVVAVHAVEFSAGGIHVHEDAGHVGFYVGFYALVVGIGLNA